jgi:hypothetical protein
MFASPQQNVRETVVMALNTQKSILRTGMNGGWLFSLRKKLTKIKKAAIFCLSLAAHGVLQMMM